MLPSTWPGFLQMCAKGALPRQRPTPPAASVAVGTHVHWLPEFAATFLPPSFSHGVARIERPEAATEPWTSQRPTLLDEAGQSGRMSCDTTSCQRESNWFRRLKARWGHGAHRKTAPIALPALVSKQLLDVAMVAFATIRGNYLLTHLESHLSLFFV